MWVCGIMRAAASFILGFIGCGAVDEFVSYTEGITIKRGSVHNHPVLAELPEWIISKYSGKQMGVVSFQLDIVSKDEHGNERRVPLPEIYNHHSIQAMSTMDVSAALYESWKKADPLGPDAPHCGRVELEKHARHGGYKGAMPNIWFGPVGGAEYRDADRDLPIPYRQIVDSPEAFVAILHWINTKVPAQQSPPFECPCVSDRVFNYDNNTIDGTKPLNFACDEDFKATGNKACQLRGYPGGYRCCEDQAWVVEPEFRDLGEDTVYGKFTFRVDDVTPETKQVVSLNLDVTGNNAEYDLPVCSESDPSKCIHVVENVQYVLQAPGILPGKPSPKAKVQLLTARGHQHVAGLGSEMYDYQTGKLLCRTENRYGDGSSEIDADGFVVGIPPCVWGQNSSNQPPSFGVFDKVRIVSYYNNTQHHMGVMGLWFMQGYISEYAQVEQFDQFVVV